MPINTKTYEEIKSNYNDFLNPSIKIFIDGNELDKKHEIYTCEIELVTENSETSTSYFKVRNIENNYEQINNFTLLEAFPLMKEIDIHMGYEENCISVFKGFIFERELNFYDSFDLALTVFCLDMKAHMRLNTVYETHTNIKSISSLIRKIAEKYGFDLKIEPTENFNSPVTLTQYGVSDFDYICNLAKEIGFEFFVLNKELIFRKFMNMAKNTLSLVPENILGLKYKTSMAGIYSDAEIYAYNQDTHESKGFTCNSPDIKIGNGKTGAEILKENKKVLTYKNSIHFNKNIEKDTKNIVQSFINLNSFKLASVEITIKGMPEIEPGHLITIKDFSKEINGSYYLQNVSHIMNSNIFQSTLVCCSNTAQV